MGRIAGPIQEVPFFQNMMLAERLLKRDPGVCGSKSEEQCLVLELKDLSDVFSPLLMGRLIDAVFFDGFLFI